jgi:predicted nucleic acid-binding protein
MSSERVAIDTNILLYILGGDKAAHQLVKGRDVVASAMVRMEAMVYHGKDEDHLGRVHTFLGRCEVVEIHRSVQDLAVELRLRYKLKLPDAIIAATAVHLRVPLITADKNFAKLNPEFEVVVYGK